MYSRRRTRTGRQLRVEPTRALAREQGVPDDEIRAIGNDRLDALAGREEALTAYAQSVAIGDVDDAVFAAAAEYLDDRTITGVMLLATHYLATARFLDALAVPLDEAFVGWTPDPCQELIRDEPNRDRCLTA